MIDSVHGSKIAGQMLEKVEEGSSASPDKQSVGAGDAERFDAAMNQQGEANASSAMPSGPEATAPKELSPGDRILQAFESMRTENQARLQEVESTLQHMSEQEKFSPAKLLEMQWKVSQTSMQVEVTTKVVDKTDQGVSTLLRNQ